MNKSIHTLIPDVYELLQRKDNWFTNELAEEFSKQVALRLQDHLGIPDKSPKLRLSKMGEVCPCALWHSIHSPDEAEKLPPWAVFKLAYGHIIEALALTLAKAAGHTVEGEQDAVELDGIQGHRDAIIDGALVDVKSGTTFGIKRLKDRSIASNDPFSYLVQLDGYLSASREDHLLVLKDKAYLWGIDKTLGHMALYEHKHRDFLVRERVKKSKDIVGLAYPPACECGTEPFGKSGNIGLDTRASYSMYKHCCFPKLRTFLYADGPVYLTKVVRKPDVTEIDRYGKLVVDYGPYSFS